MKQRIITALLIICVVLPPLVLGGVLLQILILGFTAIGCYEFLKVTGKGYPKALTFFVIFFILIMNNVSEELFIGFVALYLVCLFLLAIQFKWIDIYDVSYIFMMSIFFSLAVQSIQAVYSYGGVVMIYIALATYGTDTGAYFIGYFFGKHKLNERISPKKTIEGSVGGWIIGAAVSITFAYFMIDQLPFVLLCLGGLIMPVVGQIGDLAFSAIKRFYKIKDFGTLFPGHGGALDRIDSLLFNLVIFNLLLALVA